MTAPAARALADPHAEQAIEWMVLLRSGEAMPEDYQRFSAWRDADVANARAWERMQGMLQRTVAPLREAQQRAPGQVQGLERIVLRAPASLPSVARRKAVRGVLGLAAGGVAAGWLVDRNWPLAALRADLHTATAQRQRVSLPDGSTLVLNARTAVNIDFSSAQRRVHLLQGELVATVATDTARPFVVETEHGRVRALGTRFLVRREPKQSLVVVLEHSVRVDSHDGGQRLPALHQGQAARFDAASITRVPGDLSARAAWTDGMLVANDEPLAEVIEALRPYRRGYLRLSPQAAQLRVLGAFPLDDTDNVLRSLEQTMPLAISRYGDWLVLVDVKDR